MPAAPVSAFLFNPNRSYRTALAVCVAEYWVELLLFPAWLKSSSLTLALGVLMVVGGQALRSLAMWQAGHNFTHVVAHEKKANHQLVRIPIPYLFGAVEHGLASLDFLCIRSPLASWSQPLLRRDASFFVSMRVRLAYIHALQRVNEQPACHGNTPFQVRAGVYKISRHPSYMGWFWWSLGTQVLLANPVCLVGYALVSLKFFRERIEDEEAYLVQFFGNDYVRFQEEVGVGIPTIK